MEELRAEPWLCSIVMLLHGSSISLPSTTCQPHLSGPTPRRRRGGGRIVVTVIIVDRWPVDCAHVVDRRCVPLLGCPYFRLAACIASGRYVSSMGGTHGGKAKNEPQPLSWFVFVMHWPGFPPPGCPLVFSFPYSSAEHEEPPFGEEGCMWVEVHGWVSLYRCRCAVVAVAIVIIDMSL